MTRTSVAASILAVACASAATILQAQGRGGVEWTTSAFDAQRTGWVRNDPRISPQTMVKPGEFGAFRFLWRLKLEHDPKAATALTAPVLLDRIIGFRGSNRWPSWARNQTRCTIDRWPPRCEYHQPPRGRRRSLSALLTARRVLRPPSRGQRH